jgi:hypothetical protein
LGLLVRSSARPEQFIEEVAEPTLEHLHLGLRDRNGTGQSSVTVHVVRSYFGGRPGNGHG